MVATNVAARGLDIPLVDLIIQLNPPEDIDSYIHRSGRTGRAGTKGTAVTFITTEEEQYSIDLLKALEMSDIRPP